MGERWKTSTRVQIVESMRAHDERIIIETPQRMDECRSTESKGIQDKNTRKKAI
jgi:hypothetical protein